MNNEQNTEKNAHIQKIFRYSILFTTISVGVSSLVIILAALYLGLWLDKQNGSEPAFTIGLLLASIPISIIAMIFLVKAIIKKFNNMSDSTT